MSHVNWNSITKIFMYYKLGQACDTNQGSFVLLQIRANVVPSWGSFIIRVSVVTNWGNYYKLGQTLLQIGAGITSQGNYCKLGHNKIPNWSEVCVIKNVKNTVPQIYVISDLKGEEIVWKFY